MTNEEQESQFFRELAEFKTKYPQVCIQTWLPGDFDLEWDDPRAQDVVEEIGRAYDASIGTNWDRIEDAKERVGIASGGING